MTAIEPMKAVFDQKFVKRINGPNVKSGGTKMEYAEQVMDDTAVKAALAKVGAAK